MFFIKNNQKGVTIIEVILVMVMGISLVATGLVIFSDAKVHHEKSFAIESVIDKVKIECGTYDCIVDNLSSVYLNLDEDRREDRVKILDTILLYGGNDFVHDEMKKLGIL